MIEKSKDESFNDMETMRNSHFSAGKVVLFFLNPASPIHWPVVCSCFDCTADLNGSDKSAGQQNLKVSAIWPFTERLTGSQDSAVVAQSCPALCNPTDYSPPDSSVHEILQARILEWVAIPFSRGASRPRARETSNFFFFKLPGYSLSVFVSMYTDACWGFD